MIARASHKLVALLLSVMLGACVSSPRSSGGAQTADALDAADPCLVVPPPAAQRDTAIVVPESRHHPWNFGDATTPDTSAATSPARATAFVIGHVYQSLVTVRCDGRVVTGLLNSWTSDATGAEFRFVLNANARFTNGLPVTADDVQAVWAARARNVNALTRGIFPPFGSITINGERSLTVNMRDIEGTSPYLFAHTSVAISGGQIAGGWPVGSGAFVVDSAASRSGEVVLRPVAAGVVPTIVVRDDSASDPRDLLERGVDILQTRDPSVIDYARRGSYTIHPLPWDRTYVIAIPRAAGAPNTAEGVNSEDASAFRASLARDAVRTDAQAANPEMWWTGTASCADLSGGPVPNAGPRLAAQARRVRYEPGDPVARAIAERIVAIVRSGDAVPSDRGARVLAQLIPAFASGPAGASSTIAVAADEVSLRAGSDVAYVIHLPHRTTAPCMTLRQLKARGFWISPSALFPLVDTRASLIVRAGAPAVTVDWDGTLRIHPSRRAGGGPAPGRNH